MTLRSCPHQRFCKADYYADRPLGGGLSNWAKRGRFSLPVCVCRISSRWLPTRMLTPASGMSPKCSRINR